MFGRPAYEGKHIPGAVAWDFESDIQDPVRRDMIDKFGLEALLSKSGITSQTTIVLYSGVNNHAQQERRCPRRLSVWLSL
jgi:thiosulfate/3-mercaptopyruvate sulfurtransferase